MKKSNLITLLFLCVLIAAVILFMFFWKSEPANADDGNKAKQQNTVSTVSKAFDTKKNETKKTKSEKINTSEKPSKTKSTTVSMSDALFIGDSRTVGLMEYAEIKGADFFCSVGMSVFNVQKSTVSVPNVGKATLTQLLSGKKYGKVYIMLGVNEVGYQFDTIVAKYNDLIELVKEKQPNAVVFIQANLHVSKSRSDTDRVVNNSAINGLNSELSKLADGKSKFYIDANKLFDDENGALSADKSEDNTHLYAKYYSQWGKWIVSQTASLVGEG